MALQAVQSDIMSLYMMSLCYARPMSTTFPLRFRNPATREHLRLLAEQLNTSMNRLAEDMIERELAAMSLGLASEIEETLRRLRSLTRADIERSIDAWASTEAQQDPISARMVATDKDEFGVAAAFGVGR